MAIVRRLIAFFRLRCPHCLRGEIFESLWQMYDSCPVCDVAYEREPGYFMNAIFFGYVLSFAAMLPLNVALFIWEVAPIYFLLGNLLFLTLLSPLIFRYSRAVWMHLDGMLDPRPDPIPGESARNGQGVPK